MNKRSLTLKLMVVLLLVGILPFAIMTAVSLIESANEIKKQSYGQLEGVKSIKKAQISQFFQDGQNDLNLLLQTVDALKREAESKLESVQHNKRTAVELLINQWTVDIQAQQTLEAVTKGLPEFQKYLSNGERSKDYDKYTQGINTFVRTNGYYDYFVINIDGHIVHSQAKEADFNTNILSGKYSDSGLGRAVQAALKTRAPAIEDFSPYEPSNGQVAAFIAAPILSGTRVAGVVALQISLVKTQKIIEDRTGLGKTGESYLIGKNREKISFRSNMVTMGNGKYKVGYDLTANAPQYMKNAFAGEEATDIFTDTLGNLVMVSYSPLKAKGLEWAIITKVNVDEIIVPKEAGNAEDYYAKYIKSYGYYDLFLIHPKGRVFYSVAKEADFQTNMIDGKYADSGLGKLVKKVLETKSFGLSDFSPYAPSGNDPCAFIAQPVVHNGDVELIVALQLSLEAIDHIMQQREGMGETGETYLVGSDLLMRSDSFLDPTYHSVKASFANPSKGKVDTESVRLALSGKEGQKIILDYNGNSVLSAFAPLKVGDTQWALIAEIDEAEAFAALKKMQWVAGIVAVICIFAIVLVAVIFSRSIVKPVKGVVKTLTDLAQGEGDLTTRLPVVTRDEIGELSEKFNNFIAKLHQMITDISHGVESLSSSSAEMSSIAEDVSKGSTQTFEKANTVAAAAEEMSANMNTMAAAMEESSTNVNTVASAAEEMNSTINEIAQNAEQAREVTLSAVSKTDESTKTMNQLSTSAKAIGKVVEAITDISEQVNLLSLNATIEAARAGDAGKGFAVVANEIKDLAQQTSEASMDIKEKIDSIQRSSAGSLSSIQEISGVISDVNDIVATIATAVEEQSSATNEISENISQASSGIEDVNISVNQSSSVASEITQDISSVNQSSADIAERSNQVKTSAQDLSELAAKLDEMVGKFKI